MLTALTDNLKHGNRKRLSLSLSLLDPVSPPLPHLPLSASQLLLFNSICPLWNLLIQIKNVAVVQVTVQSIQYVTSPQYVLPFPPFYCHCVLLNLCVSHLLSCVLSSPLSLVFGILSCSAVSSAFFWLLLSLLFPQFTSRTFHLHLSLAPTSCLRPSLPLLFWSSSFFCRSEMKSWRSMARVPRA